MSRKRLLWITSCLTALAAIPGGLRAEVSAEIGGPSTYVLVVGIIEGPDPIPQIIWEQVRDVNPLRVLNASGANRDDGRPDAAYDPTTERPLVVWAYDGGGDHDIAFAQWSGTCWEDTLFLTASSADQIDPRIFVAADGRVDVVWWVPAMPPTMHYLTRAPGASVFSGEETLALPGAAGRRPSMAIWGGQQLLAYERTNGSVQEIVLARRGGTGTWTTEVIATTPRLGALDVVLHVEQGQLWMDWKHSSSLMAYKRWTGTAWGALSTVAWSDPSWFGELDARELVRDTVLGN